MDDFCMTNPNDCCGIKSNFFGNNCILIIIAIFLLICCCGNKSKC